MYSIAKNRINQTLQKKEELKRDCKGARQSLTENTVA